MHSTFKNKHFSIQQSLNTSQSTKLVAKFLPVWTNCSVTTEKPICLLNSKTSTYFYLFFYWYQWFSTYHGWLPSKQNIIQISHPYVIFLVLKQRPWQSKSKCLRPMIEVIVSKYTRVIFDLLQSTFCRKSNPFIFISSSSQKKWIFTKKD